VRILAASRFTVFGLVVLALVALAGVARLGKPVTVSAPRQTATSRIVPVSVGMRACPSPGSPGRSAAGLAVLAAAGRSGSGRATISRLSASGRAAGPLRSLSRPGVLSLSAVPAAPAAGRAGQSGSTTGGDSAVVQPGGVMIQATGSMAQGLEAEQTSGGVVTASCGSPGTDFWFAVPGQQSAGVIELDLMNVDSQASTVDVNVFTDTGPLQTGTDTGINVPAHSLVVQSLGGLVHGARAIALHVRTSVGRVVAALRESSRPGEPGAWLPPAQFPSRHLVIPGLPGTKGTRSLYVADAGGSDAQVSLTVVSPAGTYQPTGATAIDIPAGSASRIDLTSLSGVAGAVVLKSSVPVTAAVAIPGGLAGAPGAMTAAAPALQEQGILADVGQRADTTTLVLSAPGRAARVRLTTGVSGLTSGDSPAGGTGARRPVSIPAKHSITVTIAAPRGAHPGAGFAVVLAPLPGSGPVYAGGALAQAHGGVLGIIPVTSALTRVALPAVSDTLMTVAPGPRP
jgi:hypothetical protein